MKSLNRATDNIATLTQDITPQLRNLMNSADQSLSGENGALAKLNHGLATIEATFNNYDALAADLSKTSQNWNAFANSNDKRLSQIIPRFNSVLIDLQKLMNGITVLAQEADKTPNMFIFGKQNPKKGPGE